MSRPQVLKRLVTLAVLLSLCSALTVSTNTTVQAAATTSPSAPAANLANTKISPDLQELILSGQGDQRVKVIRHYAVRKDCELVLRRVLKKQIDNGSYEAAVREHSSSKRRACS